MKFSSMCPQATPSSHPIIPVESMILLSRRWLRRAVLVMLLAAYTVGWRGEIARATVDYDPALHRAAAAVATLSNASDSKDNSTDILLIGGIAITILMMGTVGAVALTRRAVSQ